MNNYALERDLLDVLGPLLARHGLAYQGLSVDRLAPRLFERRAPGRFLVIVEVVEG